MNFNKSVLAHLLPITAFFVIVSIYFSPLYTGKTLVQSDNVQLTGVSSEITAYKEKGEQIHWNNREFSGVPLIGSSQYNPFRFLNGILFYGLFPKPVMMVFFLFLGFYTLLAVFEVPKWLAALGSFAYAFSSFNIISVEVGHDNKVLAIAFMAPVLAGIILAYRGKLLSGGLLTALSAGFHLYFGHIQITYYLLIIVIGYFATVIYGFIKSKDWPLFFKATGVLTLATVIALGCNFGKLYSTWEYADYSTRGGSDLSQKQGNASSSGLDKDYALSWSNGILETFTLAFPYFHGGASREELSEQSQTYKALSSRGVEPGTIKNVMSNIPLYWGDQPFTGGPIYFGGIVCFLFVLSLFVLNGPLKWWAIGITILSLLLAMGKNLEWFTNIFFYHVPLYNKFRSVTMILSMAQLMVPLLAILGVKKIFEDYQSVKKIDIKIIQAGSIVIGIGLFFLLFKGSFFNFAGTNDKAYGFPDWLLNAIEADRKDLFNSSIIRTIVFVVLSGGGLWLYVKKTLKLNYLVAGLFILVVIDLWVVDKRYLSADDFQSKRKVTQQAFQPTPADQQINQDKGYFRVLNLASQSPFSDGITSYHHYSILGYNAIKMQRYQELIDKYISKMDTAVLNMLNTRYIIVQNQQNGQPVAQKNYGALGNAWLVKEAKYVDGADDEYEKLGNIDPAKEAIADRRLFGNAKIEGTFSGEGKIELSSYHPEKMTYKFSSSEDQFAVFSEIYYAPGWKAYLDGQPVNYLRVNYILRGMRVPKGQHEIVFKYEPASVGEGKKVIIICAILMGLWIAWGLKDFLKKE